MKLQEEGTENPALQEQVARVVSEPYRQPYLSRFLIFLCRLHFRCKLVNRDHIITDDDNPLVFLCNHGEFYGPMACKIYVPVPIRAWANATMMFDKKSVSQYIYENTTSHQEGMPEFEKRILARMAAWLSVNVMGQLECIPVYKESPLKLRETFRLTLEAMEAGDNILIFPENPEQKYPREGIEMKGAKYKSHYLALRKWVFDALKEKHEFTNYDKGQKKVRSLNEYKKEDVGSLFDNLEDIDLRGGKC